MDDTIFFLSAFMGIGFTACALYILSLIDTTRRLDRTNTKVQGHLLEHEAYLEELDERLSRLDGDDDDV